MKTIRKDIEVELEELEIECADCNETLDDEDGCYCKSCYDTVVEEKDELEEKVGSLEGDLADKQDEVDALESKNADLETEVERLKEKLAKAKSIDDILGVLDHYDMKDKASIIELGRMNAIIEVGK